MTSLERSEHSLTELGSRITRLVGAVGVAVGHSATFAFLFGFGESCVCKAGARRLPSLLERIEMLKNM